MAILRLLWREAKSIFISCKKVIRKIDRNEVRIWNATIIQPTIATMNAKEFADRHIENSQMMNIEKFAKKYLECIKNPKIMDIAEYHHYRPDYGIVKNLIVNACTEYANKCADTNVMPPNGM